MTESNTNKRFSRRQAAEYLGISYKTLTRWASDKSVLVPYSKVGHKVVYSQADLDVFLNTTRVEG